VRDSLVFVCLRFYDKTKVSSETITVAQLKKNVAEIKERANKRQELVVKASELAKELESIPGVKDTLTLKTRQELLVVYGYLRGLNGIPINTGWIGHSEKFHVPVEMIRSLEKLLFPEKFTSPVMKDNKEN
jgi:hypothetical protein